MIAPDASGEFFRRLLERLEAGGGREHLACEMRRGAGAGGAVMQGAGLALGELVSGAPGSRSRNGSNGMCFTTNGFTATLPTS